MSSSPGLRSGPLAMPISRVSCRPCSASTSAATRDLPLAAVDHEQVRRRELAGDDPRAAPRQRLAHRRVVVAAGGRRHVEAPVLAGLHRQPVEDHARRDGALAHRVRHVEALDALRRRRQAERRLQRGEAVVLRRLLRELLADRELRRSAPPSRATRGARRRDWRRSGPAARPAPTARRRARRRRRRSATTIVGGTGRST